MYHIGRKDSGFTLIELMVALVLSAVLMSALYFTFFSVKSVGGEAQEGLNRAIEAGRFFDRFSTDIHSAYFKPERPKTAFKGGIDMSTSVITFTALTYPILKEGYPTSDLVAISYFARQSEDGYTVYREVRHPYTGDSFKVEVLEGVGGFEVSYFNGVQWSGAWDAKLESKVPEAVKVAVVLRNGEELFTTARTMVKAKD